MSETTVPAKPLFDWLDHQPRGAKAAFARKLGYSESRLSMMRVRGIPKGALIDITRALNMTVERYMELAWQKGGKIEANQEKILRGEMQSNIPHGDAEKLLALIRAFLNTDAEGKSEVIAAVQAVAGEDGAKHRADNGRKRKRR